MTKRFPEGATTVIGASAMSKLLRGTKGRSLPVRISTQVIPRMVRMKS